MIFQVKKIYENEKRLQAGEHSLDLLAHDFEKNYNMYIFPVHWQFGQLDQHPVDGYVDTELFCFHSYFEIYVESWELFWTRSNLYSTI